MVNHHRWWNIQPVTKHDKPEPILPPFNPASFRDKLSHQSLSDLADTHFAEEVTRLKLRFVGSINIHPRTRISNSERAIPSTHARFSSLIANPYDLDFISWQGSMRVFKSL